MSDLWAERRPVEVGGLTFDVALTGPEDGVPVVLLHGFPQTADSWRSVAPRLARAGLRLIAPDQRGYSPGARPSEVAAYAVPHLVDDVIGLMGELGYDSAHVVGHDWGAAVAWSLTAHHPERVRSLVALSVPHLAAYGWALVNDDDQRERASYIGLFRQPGKAEDLLLEDDGRRLRAMFGDAMPEEHIATYVGVLSEPAALTAALSWYRAMGRDLGATPPVTVPTTYVWGDDDWALGAAGARRCGEHIHAEYRFVPVAGASHWLPEEQPELVADEIVARVRA
ncbi:alpha/beta hydrolase [Mumia sp. zg.B53]|uniref:alpha/beta fold hydrolase n=1 Tax=unclassified Mumia TaxID=2621872 RepID=UPI001C6F0912|nr:MULTISPECIES: alpha/beta hydrolase [unclassified Mumia]MBW9210406.1 alpha/beta hydrolase [Mumia sp. zg.B21]MBW9215028.1 alpha/beta hydrolase [Mumia sp. zg.B53]MDD9350098.1 alpha/beta hydrolase [Mumia sp.]